MDVLLASLTHTPPWWFLKGPCGVGLGSLPGNVPLRLSCTGWIFRSHGPLYHDASLAWKILPLRHVDLPDSCTFNPAVSTGEIVAVRIHRQARF